MRGWKKVMGALTWNVQQSTVSWPWILAYMASVYDVLRFGYVVSLDHFLEVKSFLVKQCVLGWMNRMNYRIIKTPIIQFSNVMEIQFPICKACIHQPSMFQAYSFLVCHCKLSSSSNVLYLLLTCSCLLWQSSWTGNP